MNVSLSPSTATYHFGETLPSGASGIFYFYEDTPCLPRMVSDRHWAPGSFPRPSGDSCVGP